MASEFMDTSPQRKRSNTVASPTLYSVHEEARSPDRKRSTSDTIICLTGKYTENLGKTVDELTPVSLADMQQRREREMEALNARASDLSGDVSPKVRRKSAEQRPTSKVKRPEFTRRISCPSRTMTSMKTLGEDIQDSTYFNEEELYQDGDRFFAPKEIRRVAHSLSKKSNPKHVEFWGDVLLHEAISRDDVEEVCDLLQKDPYLDLRAPDSNGITPLHRASIEGAYRCLNLLISQNVSVNVKDVDGWSPLHDAVYHGHIRCAAALITAGANAEAETNDFTKPIEMAEQDDMLLLVGRAMAAPGMYFDPDRETLV